MKLYVSPISAPSRFLMSLVRHLNVEVELVEVDLMSGDQKSEAHLKRHPMGKIPVLEDGDFCLFESLAIARYICDVKAPGNTLYPTDPKQRAKID
mmetsp:Transcript_27718/g.26757  ORF Transcript_27718/g.26757 Transcript_27718/m.26757 type:complete len:95 (-) Transcript_27718:413-697(-)